MLRAEFLAGAVGVARASTERGERARAFAARLADLERRSGGRLGVCALDSTGRIRFAQRASERFPMCSTFKVLAVGAVLARVDHRKEQLDRRIPFGRRDLLDGAPVTKQNVQRGSMTVGALCGAAIEWSDNTAANLLLASLGGPSGVTHFARTLGDPMTRLDRNEPSLNTALPDDPRDTTTPHSMARNAHALLSSDALSMHSRELLTAWLTTSRTGAERLRAGVPSGWRAGDKTGSGAHGTSNDVAVFWPPASEPLFVAAYLTGSNVGDDARDAVLADVGRVAAAVFRESTHRCRAR